MSLPFAERDRLTTELDLLASWFAERYARRGLEFDDARQEALTAIWVAAGKFRPTRAHCHVPFSAFARKFIVRALERARAKARCRGITQAGERVTFAGIDLDQITAISEATDSGALGEALGRAIASLQPEERMLVLRRYGLDGLPSWSLVECANEFLITVASVKKRLQHARAKIGAELRSAGWDPANWQRRATEEKAIKAG
jgi:RNA polymerase sigma factor (sigma-70 family)